MSKNFQFAITKPVSNIFCEICSANILLHAINRKIYLTYVSVGLHITHSNGSARVF